MGYPTPKQCRSYAAHARRMADEYEAEGVQHMADRRRSDAEFYEDMAHREEARLIRRAPKLENAA